VAQFPVEAAEEERSDQEPAARPDTDEPAVRHLERDLREVVLNVRILAEAKVDV